ncbi:MAG: polyribonucleotide nucleotidyltransferase [Bacteroidetes bacterium]|nr:polyribonucleotide nucleotidyltransferase [Bacteroidota bacterium]
MSNKPQGFRSSIPMSDGRSIEIETGVMAKQAHGSVVVKYGDTMLLATVVSNKDAKENIDFLPLSVDYQEKFAAVGRIPGSFHRREARLTDYEILISRIVDRAIRPLFPNDYHSDTQVAITLMSSDKNFPPDCLVGLAASACLMVSNIPFQGPISEVRVAKINGQLIINPSISDLALASMELIVSGTEKDINMVEGECSEVSEEEMLEALKFAHEAIKIQCKAQWTLCESMGGRPATREYNHETNDEELRKQIFALTYDRVYQVAKSGASKEDRSANFKAIITEYLDGLSDEDKVTKTYLAKKYYHDVEKEAMRKMILDESIRLDGRKLDEVRPIWSEVNYLPAAHGSAVFTRGETQAVTSVTLGGKLDEQLLDAPMNYGYSRLMLHYNFPSFSTGEARPNRGPGRREIGHGNLALRGLRKALPGPDVNPYVIRIVSDILESNGSSSMATVCAGSLALMDAGIKINGGVSGVAMGLISDEATGKYSILTDILGDEDHLGDMDFKVVGTANGITACQMDIKINGLRWEMVAEALAQAKKGRANILNEMNKTLSVANTDYKPHTPRVERLLIDKDQIGAVIGPGGKVIQGIQKETGASISITEDDNKGIVEILSSDAESMAAALRIIKGIVAVPEIGEVYEGKVKSIVEFGAFIEILPGKDGLLHISEISWDRVAKMDGIFKEGDMVKVKLVEVDKKTGKLRLSRKALMPKPEQAEQKPQA